MLKATQTLYKDSNLTFHINGRRGETFQSFTGVKQDCPISPTSLGLYMDGLHRYLMSIAVLDVPMLSSGAGMPTLDNADNTALMASSAHSMHYLINTVLAFCVLMGIIISEAKRKAHINGYATAFKYLGLTFHAGHGLQPTFLVLK